MSTRPRRESAGKLLCRKEIQLAHHSLPGDNAYGSTIKAVRERVLATAQTVDPALAKLAEKWDNNATETAFYIEKAQTRATLPELIRAFNEEFSGAANVTSGVVEVAGAIHKSKRESVAAYVVHVFTKGVTASVLHTLKAIAPHLFVVACIAVFLWVTW